MVDDPRDEVLRRELEDAASGDEPDTVDVDDMVEAARALRASAELTRLESSAAQADARARFQQQLRSLPPATLEPRRWRSPMHSVRRGWLAVGSVAAVLALIVLSAVVLPSLSGNVDTAAAQVLEPGDVVQVEGVVRETPGQLEGDVVVASDFGDVAVRLDGDSVVIDGDNEGGGADLKAGDRVVVSGLVEPDRRLRVSAISISARQQQPPTRRPLEHIERLEEALDARVVAVAMTGDGETVRVVLAAGNRRLLTVVPAATVLGLFDGGGALGRGVRFSPPAEGAEHSFDVQLSPPERAPAGIVGVRGIIGAAADHVLTVATLDGRVRVRITDRTAMRFGLSGLDAETFDGGRGAVGHTIGANGRVDPESGEVVADVVLIGRPPSIRDRR